jgi:hypothetical protein
MADTLIREGLPPVGAPASPTPQYWDPTADGGNGAFVKVEGKGGAAYSGSKDGGHTTIGATTDPESASGNGTVVAILKRIRSILGGILSVKISQTPGENGVAVSNFPATQTVTGDVMVSNLPATQTVAGNVGVTFLPALPSGTNEIGKVAQGTPGASPWPVSLSGRTAANDPVVARLTDGTNYLDTTHPLPTTTVGDVANGLTIYAYLYVAAGASIEIVPPRNTEGRTVRHIMVKTGSGNPFSLSLRKFLKSNVTTPWLDDIAIWSNEAGSNALKEYIPAAPIEAPAYRLLLTNHSSVGTTAHLSVVERR